MQQLQFCEKHGITPNELLLLEILLIGQEDDDPEIVKYYFTSPICSRGKTTELLQNLQDSGIINKSYKVPQPGTKFDLYDVPINKHIVKDFYRASFEMGKELFEAYPMFGIVNNNQVGIRSVSKKFDSLEEFYNFYGKTIRWKPEVHNHILELIEWGKERNVICTTLANFIIDQRWNELEALKEGTMSNINFDAIKLV